MKDLVSVSIVSHGQFELVQRLLGDLGQYCSATPMEVILTINVEESLPIKETSFPFPIRLVRNPVPKGFGQNHNAAFKLASGRYFCVVNPDIRLTEDPFPALIGGLAEGVGVVAPLVKNMEGGIEDSARRFPTPWRILRKVFGGGRTADYSIAGETIRPDWVGGMFMLFTHDVFEKMHGFDERYFLYYEDVDLCARLTLEDLAVLLCPQTGVIHEARRSSHRNFRFLKWHISSMSRFFLSGAFLRIMKRRMFPARKAAVR